MHIIGASGHAKVVMDILELTSQDIDGLWDDNPDLIRFNNYPVNGNIKQFSNIQQPAAIVAIGNNKIRKKIAEKIHADFGIAKHPSCVCCYTVRIGEGNVLMANSSINSDVVLGNHVIINTNASIDHDCKIGDYVHISPQAGLAGNVVIGEGTHIGIGACVIQGIEIGKWATIGAGAVVINDVPDYAVVVGNPGRVIKFNKIDE